MLQKGEDQESDPHPDLDLPPRDQSDRERGDTIMTCVSRSLSRKLVLDL